MPERRLTTLVPPRVAWFAAASQSLTRSARNPAPTGSDSTAGRSPVPPYQPMAEPQSSTGGGCGAAAMASVIAVVLMILLSRSTCLRAGVQRPPATGAPDRWIMASAPLSTAGSRPPARIIGSQRTSPGAPGARRTRRVTLTPSSSRLAARALPMSPDAAESTMRTAIPPAMSKSSARPTPGGRA